MSPVEFLSALVAPVSAPAGSGEAGDAAAFETAVAAAAAGAGRTEGADPAAPAPKKPGFLQAAKFVQAAAPAIEVAADLPASPPATPAVPAATAVRDRFAEPGEAAEPVEAADEATPGAEPASGAAPAATPAPVQAAPAEDAEAEDAHEGEGVEAVERTLAALLDRILVETGASKNAPGAAERLEAAQEAIGRVLDRAPPHVRPKLEALFARMASAADAADGGAAPVQAEAAGAEEADGALAADAAPATSGESTLPPAVLDLIRKVAGDAPRPEIRLAAAAASPSSTEAITDEARASADGRVGEAAVKPATGTEAGSDGAKSGPKLEAAPEPAAASVRHAEIPVDALAPVDTAAGAPAAHAGARVIAAEVARGSPETVAHLSAEILKKLEGRSTRFDMELHPADLGRVDVRLTIEADGRLNAQLAFDNPVAAADLRARADELRRSLEQAGFQLSEDSFSFAERGEDGRAFEDARQQFADGGRGRARARAFRAGGEAAELADAAPVARRAVRLGVDVRI